jgi:hypothetical protein
VSPRLGGLAVAVAALVVAAAAVLAVRSGGTEDVAPRTTTPEVAEPGAGPSDLESELDEAIAAAKEFVSEVRGLPFLRPVKVQLLDGEAFRERLLGDIEEDRADVEVDQRVLRALGLLEPDVDLFDTIISFIGDAVVGFYDPEEDALVVRATGLTPYARSTLVHELTHALDDQHFELHREELEDDDSEALFAFHALVEGNAVRVEEAYQATMSEDERRELAEEERRLQGSIDTSDVPMVVMESIGFPYSVGPPFVAALLAAGGEDRVDDAFRVPPVTSEHIVDPEAWLAGEGELEVARPEPGGEVIDEGTYGLWALLLTLLDELGQAEAGRAAIGWGGDKYVAWDEGDRTCVRAAFAMDTPGDLEELDGALRRWAVAQPDASVERRGELVGFTACG